jgi:hypothetical protein
MYKIIGADQKEYGPISADQLRQWIAEGRVNGSTQVQPEGATGWKTVSELPEFAVSVPGSAPSVPVAPIQMPGPRPAAKANQVAVWSMITGIIAIIPCCWAFGGVIGLISIVLGIVGLSQIKQNSRQTGSGFAIAGIVMGILSLLITVAIWLTLAAFPQIMTNFQNSFGQ